jgi:tungstate transport system substrate-binding protein
MEEERNLKQESNWFAIALVVIVLFGVGAGVFEIIGTTPTLTLQCTTDVQDSGLLDLLAPAFESLYHCNFRWIAVGTGQALTNAGNGLGDVVIVHSATYELAFVNHTDPQETDTALGITYAGQGIFRVNFCYNFFIVVGPKNDPLGIANTTKYPTPLNSTQMFQLIYAAGQSGSPAGVTFVSRGDNSGTYNKEVSIWKALKDWNSTVGSISPYGWVKNVGTNSWYIQTGQGQGPTLTIANQKSAYCLTDLSTWLNMENSLPNLKVVSAENLTDLKNIYSVIAVDPALHSNVNFDLAKRFIYFMCEQAQNIIGNDTINGQRLYHRYVHFSPSLSPSGSLLDDVYTGTFAANLANASYVP